MLSTCLDEIMSLIVLLWYIAIPSVLIRMRVRNPIIIRYSMPICALFLCIMPLGKIYKILWYNLLKDVYKDYYENYEKRYGCFCESFACGFFVCSD